MARGDQWVSAKGGSRRSYSGGNSTMLARRLLVVVLVLILILALGSVVQLVRGVPNPTYTATLASASTIPGTPPTIAWPAHAEAAAEIMGVGSLGQHGDLHETEIASVTKMTTALLTLKAHPLSLGESGPKLTMTAQDYQIYVNDKNANDSVGAIKEGEVLSEQQLLELLLIPSADNIATVLANWDAGSVSRFVTEMNNFATSLGLHHTHYGDPSGVTPSTLSIPRDQLKIEALFMANPVLANIASMEQATLPVAGTVYNVNYALGHDNIVGAKTGSILTGSFAMATQIKMGQSNLLGLGTILDVGGVEPLINALHDGEAMAKSLQTIPRELTVLRKGQVVGYLDVPGAKADPVIATETVSEVGWPGLSESFTPTLFKSVYGLPAGAKVGTATLTVGEQLKIVPLKVANAVAHPSIVWRLTHF
jgi:D-alanyl-D-alanine carboxypeptidase (penicillin-binding protein 5/6)